MLGKRPSTNDPLNPLDLLRHFQDTDADGFFDAGEPLLAEFDYAVLADGRRSGVTEKQLNPASGTLEETRIDWFYDNLGRLTRELYDSQEKM